MADVLKTASSRGPIVFLILALVLYEVHDVLIPFVIAGIIAYLASPLIQWAHARTGWPRAIPAVIFFIIFVLILAASGYAAYLAIVQEVKPFLSDLPGTLARTIHQVLGNSPIRIFGQSLNPDDLAEKGVKAARDWLDTGHVLTFAAIGLTGIFAGLLFLVILLYFLLTGPRIAEGLFWLVPPDRRLLAQRLWSRLNPVLMRYFVGVAVVVACTATLAYLGLGLALRLPHALVLAVLTGFLEIVPVIGPASSALIAGVVAIQSSKSFVDVLAYAAYATALRVTIDNILGPIVLGRAGRIHPVLVIFCFVIGGLLFGLVGVILAVPTALVVRTVITMRYEQTSEPEPQVR